MQKLVWCDLDTLNKGAIAKGVYTNDNGVPTMGEFVKDKDGVIRKVIKNGSTNKISGFLIPAIDNAVQMLTIEEAKKAFSQNNQELLVKGETILHIVRSGGYKDETKTEKVARPLALKINFNASRGLDKHDARAYDITILSDSNILRTEGEYSL